MAGAGGRGRTDTLLPEPDFESGASTNSTTPAWTTTPGTRSVRVQAERGYTTSIGDDNADVEEIA